MAVPAVGLFSAPHDRQLWQRTTAGRLAWPLPTRTLAIAGSAGPQSKSKSKSAAAHLLKDVLPVCGRVLVQDGEQDVLHLHTRGGWNKKGEL